MLKGKWLRKLLYNFCLIIVATFCAVPPSVVALDMDLWAQNYIIGYNPDEILDDCPPGTSGYYTAGKVSGDSNKDKVWNYIVDANIDGISNRPEVIAAIMGNIERESGYNPFDVYDDGKWQYYGLYQSEAGEGVKAAIDAAGLGGYWKSNNAPQEAQDKAIAITLDVLLKGGSTGSFADRFRDFLNCLDSCTTYTSGEAGASSFAELFEVTVERAVCIQGSGRKCVGYSQPLEDQKVFNYTQEHLYRSGQYHTSNLIYQHVRERRDAAKSIFNEYASGGGSSSLASSDVSTVSGSDVTIIGDSITDGAKEKLEAALPGVAIYSQVGKHFYIGDESNPGGKSGFAILQDLISGSNLRQIVVFALGTNDEDGITEEQAQEVVDEVGPDRTIVFVTNRTLDYTYTGNNNIFKHLATTNSNVKIADYSSALEGHLDEYLDPDGIHPNEEGKDVFVQTIVDVVKNVEAIEDAPSACNSSNNSIIGPITTVEGAIPFLKKYVEDVNAKFGRNFTVPTKLAQTSTANWASTITYTDPRVIGPPAPSTCYTAADCAQCVALSVWFIQAFTNYNYTKVATSNNPDAHGHGIFVTQNLVLSNPGQLTETDTPSVFSIFSSTGSGSGYGHTGVVVGKTDGGEWITIESNLGGGCKGCKGYLAVLTYTDEQFAKKSSGNSAVQANFKFVNVNEGLDLSSVGLSLGTPALPDGFEIFDQFDNRWKDEGYGNCLTGQPDENHAEVEGGSIGAAGCGPTSLANAINYLKGKQEVTPLTIAQKAVAAGYRACGNGTSHAIANLAIKYNLKVQRVENNYWNVDTISKGLREGKVLQVSRSGTNPFTAGGHFIDIYGITSSGKWLIFDSNGQTGQENSKKEWDPNDIIAAGQNGTDAYWIYK